MAPEQIRGRRPLGPPADLFALDGVLASGPAQFGTDAGAGEHLGRKASRRFARRVDEHAEFVRIRRWPLGTHVRAVNANGLSAWDSPSPHCM